MSSGRRAIVAILATYAVMLATGQPSNGAETRLPTQRVPQAAAATTGPASAGTTVRASVTSTGGQAPTGASRSMISGSGRWVVFTSKDDLADLANEGRSNVFIRDLADGETWQVSRGSDGLPPDGDSTQPSISGDGRFVSFITTASNVVTPSFPEWTATFGHIAVGARAAAASPILVVCDRGRTAPVCAQQYTSVDQPLDGGVRPRLSGDGTRIVWTQHRDASGWQTDIRVGTVNLNVNRFEATNIRTVDGGLSGATGSPVLDRSGRHVAFVSWGGFSVRLVEATLNDDNSTASSKRIDRDPDDASRFLGDWTPRTPTSPATCVVIDAPSMSDDGALVAFHARVLFCPTPTFAAGRLATSVVAPADREVVANVDAATSQWVSVNNSGQPVDGENGAISGDGRFAAFVTNAVNTHDGTPVTGTRQIVVRDLDRDAARAAEGLTRLEGALATPSATASCAPPCASSNTGGFPMISLDAIGSRISFDASATDLLANNPNGSAADTNDASDVFVRTWQPSVSSGTADFGAVQVGTSIAANVVVTVTGFGPLTLAPSAPRVGGGSAGDFTIIGSDCAAGHVLYDSQSCLVALRFTPSAQGIRTTTLFLSADQYSAARPALTVRGMATPSGPEVAPGDTVRASLTDAGTEAGEAVARQSMISGNGRWDVFVSSADLGTLANRGMPNIYVRDLADPQHTVQISLGARIGPVPTAATRRVAPTRPNGTAPNGPSSRPSISDDGRFISFTTRATNVVPSRFLDGPGAGSPVWTIVVCDRDPSGARDEAGNLILDRVQAGTQLPDELCFPVESGSPSVYGRSADESTTARLAGNGTRITWVEDDASFYAQRAVVATLSSPGGALQPPTEPQLVPINDVPFFTGSATRVDYTDARQGDPRLTGDGKAAVFSAETGCCGDMPQAAVIETTLSDGRSVRLDTTDDGVSYLGATNGFFDPPATTADGRRVAFAYDARGAIPSLVYAVTLSASGHIQTLIASRDNTGELAAGYSPALSGDGRYLAFQTDASNMHNGVDNLSGPCFSDLAFVAPSVGIHCQIVARDLDRDTARAAADESWAPSELVSSSLTEDCMPAGRPLPAGRTCAGNANSMNPSIDATGSEIGFDSVADDLVDAPADTNSVGDVFVHTWRPALLAPAFAFGAVSLAEHTDRAFTITESGFGPISLGASAITGADAGDFQQLADRCAGQTLNTGERCTVTLRFTPAAARERQATFATRVDSNGYPRHNPPGTIAFDPVLVRTLTGTGASAELVAEPAVLDFGSNLPLAPAKTKTVSVTNPGNTLLELTSVLVEDSTTPGAAGDYTAHAAECVNGVPPHGSCLIAVTFIGHAVGMRDALLRITDNTTVGSHAIGLTAAVPKPEITINPGVSPPGRVTTVDGTGFAPGKTVVVAIEDSPEQAQVRADKHGEFTVAVVLFRHTPQGPRTILARIDGVRPTISARGPLLVALGSVLASDLVTRH